MSMTSYDSGEERQSLPHVAACVRHVKSSYVAVSSSSQSLPSIGRFQELLKGDVRDMAPVWKGRFNARSRFWGACLCQTQRLDHLAFRTLLP